MAATTAATRAPGAGGFTAVELEMFAEDQMVQIVPHFTFQDVHFLSGCYGPFQAKMPTEVPLWLALQLKQRQLCTIRLPKWLEQRELEEQHQKEDASRDQNILSAVDFHYQEVSALLLRHSPESFTDQNGNPRVTLKDLEELREAKLHTSLRRLEKYEGGIEIANISALEVNRLRGFLVGSLQHYYKIHQAMQELKEGAETSQGDDYEAGASL